MPYARSGYLWLAAVVLLSANTAAASVAPGCPSVPIPRLTLPVTAAALAAGEPVTIVALGSSSTAGSGATSADRTYPARLQAALRAAWPGAAITVLNRGIGGEQADQMLARVGKDVLPAKPTLVIWQAGANEAIKGMDPALFQSLLDRGVHQIQDAGSDVVLMDNQVSPQIERAAHHEAYVEVVAEEAAARRVSLFSRTALMRAWRAIDPTAHNMVGPDGMHHTDRGYACVAASLARAIEKAVARPVLAASIRK